MDTHSIIMILVMITLTAFSGFFSATETAFSTFNRLKIKNMAQSGNKRAAAVIRLDENYDKLITTILIGNNIVNISLTAISTVLFIKFFADMGATISTIVITIVVLIFGEISPKVLAKDHADGYVIATARIIAFLVKVFLPVTFIFSGWRKLLVKVFKSNDNPTFTEDELMTMVDEAKEEGGLGEEESDLIKSAIEFSDVTAGEILTPRVDIVSVTADTPMEEVLSAFIESGYSRLPVCGETIDDVEGILHEKDFFFALHSGKDGFADIMQKPLFVSKHIKIHDLLQLLKTSKCHMAIVIDEFGGMLGVVTMEDIIEELIGDVWDEHDEVENYFIQDGENAIIVDCSAELDDLFDRYDIEPDEDEGEMPQTVNGWLLMQFGNFPDKGESFEYKGIKVEVLDTDAKRVISVRVTELAPEDSDDEKE